jgi:ketosteroid isomerase-like protein
MLGRMKTGFFAPLALLLITSLPVAVLADTDSELRAVEESRRAAIKAKDFSALGNIYAPEFMAVAANGQVVDRAALFKVFRSTDPSILFTTDEVRVLPEGDTAVFFGRLIGKTADGNTVFASRFTHVFVRRHGMWVCISGQSTPLPD